jgi:hypothetical protein
MRIGLMPGTPRADLPRQRFKLSIYSDDSGRLCNLYSGSTGLFRGFTPLCSDVFLLSGAIGASYQNI